VLEPVAFTPIGIVRTPFPEHAGMPIQTVAAKGVHGTIELDPAYAPALADLDGFTYLHLITYMHRTGGISLRVTPYLDTVERGVFATRSPKRPNPIGLSLVRLVRIDGAVLHVEELDLLDGTPLLDIKPYVPPFDDRADARYGWFEQRAQNVHSVRADARFAEPSEDATD
jgi:tRNA-Thr(GGU) m(6)t(6)A37 methyltransferase TsaA